MLENLEILASAKRAAEEQFQSLQALWKQVLQRDSQKCGVPSAILLFSSSFLFLFFTFTFLFSECSGHFSLLMVGTLGLHAFLRLTRNTICTTLHYKLLYSYTLSLFVFFYSPVLPSSQSALLLAVLVPLYYHFLTSSVNITLLFSVPYHFFLLCSLFRTSIPEINALAAFIAIPTMLWAQMKTLKRKVDYNKEMEINGKQTELSDVNNHEPLQIPDLKEKKGSQRESQKGISESETEEHEKVILGINHDCRNLLNSLKATLTLIKDETNGDEMPVGQDDNLQSAVAITEHLTLLLTNLLDYLKRKNDDTDFHQETKLTTTLEKIWLMISPNLKKKNLGGSITIRNGTPLNLHIDEHKLMGVLLNLIGNSTKFTDTGHIKINVHWRENSQNSVRSSFDSRHEEIPIIDRKAGNADLPLLKKTDSKEQKEWKNDLEQPNPVLSKTTFFDLRDIDSISFAKKCFTVMNEAHNQPTKPTEGVLVISVRDTGCGIDDQSLKKIFKKYGQVGEDQEKSKLGLGLGLWYTKYLLNKLQGKIDFRSSKNVGTWVKVEIPCKVACRKREIHQMIRPEVPIQKRERAPSENNYVFVRENDRLGSLLITEYIKKHIKKNIQVLEIKSITEILRSEIFRSGSFSLVLGESSATRQEIQALNMLKRLNQGQKMSILLLRDSEDLFDGGQNGWGNVDADTIIKKPLRTIQLEQVVSHVQSMIQNKPVTISNEGRQSEEAPRVLVVDDDDTIRMFLQRCLEKKGIPCLVARNGLDAVEICKKESQNLKIILMDSEMPKMNGLDATKVIRQISNNYGLKIVGLTGDNSEEFRMKAKENGMNEIFIKPLPVDQLLHIVNSVL